MLFSKTNSKTNSSSSAHPIASAHAGAIGKAAGAQAKKLVPSVIANGMHILGNIVCDGIIDFDGTTDGNIRCHTLTVRTNGLINGEITAENVIVYGKVKGTIKAKGVQLLAGSQVEGVVMHETLSIEDGAFLDGKCKRTDKIHLNDNGESGSDADDDNDLNAAPIKVLENLRLIG